MTSMFEELKVEFRSALQREEPQDATRRQHIMLQMLEDIRSGVTEGMVQNYSTRIGDLLFQLSEVATRQGRIQSGMCYGRRCTHFRRDERENSMDFCVVSVQQNLAERAQKFQKWMTAK